MEENERRTTHTQSKQIHSRTESAHTTIVQRAAALGVHTHRRPLLTPSSPGHVKVPILFHMLCFLLVRIRLQTLLPCWSLCVCLCPWPPVWRIRNGRVVGNRTLYFWEKMEELSEWCMRAGVRERMCAARL